VVDLLKNHVFRQAGDRLAEAQAAWQAMTTAITEVGEEPDVKVFIRQAWISKYGLTLEKVLYDAIKRQITNKARVIEYVKELAESSHCSVQRSIELQDSGIDLAPDAMYQRIRDSGCSILRMGRATAWVVAWWNA